MAEVTIQVKRYAQAAFKIALESNAVSDWLQDLKEMAALTDIPELVQVMENPAMPEQAKRSLLESRLKLSDKMAMNLLYLLVNKGKFSLIKGIYQNFSQLVDELQSIDKAEVTTAVPLDKEERQRITQYLAQIRGKQIVMTEKVDAGIIGGMIARVGGKIIDGSTASRLAALKNALAEAGG